MVVAAAAVVVVVMVVEVVVAVVVEVVVVVAVAVVAVAVVAAAEAAMTTTTTIWTPRVRVDRVLPIVDDDAPTISSTMPRCNNDWRKSCKINARRPLDVVLRASRRPTRSPRRTKMVNDPA